MTIPVRVEGKDKQVEIKNNTIIVEGRGYAFEETAQGVLWDTHKHHVDILDHHIVIDGRPLRCGPLVMSADAQRQTIVRTPITGRVSKICVRKGQKVREGETLCIIEAMKMENHILAQRDGVVKEIIVDTQTVVKSEQVLLYMTHEV